MTLGDPLAMIAYSIGVLLLIKLPKEEFTDLTQTWYADDASALGTFTNIKLYFNSLKRFVPSHEYYPEPSKSVMIVHPDNIKVRKQFVLSHVFKV